MIRVASRFSGACRHARRHDLESFFSCSGAQIRIRGWLRPRNSASTMTRFND
jgi:hypothetical protein